MSRKLRTYDIGLLKKSEVLLLLDLLLDALVDDTSQDRARAARELIFTIFMNTGLDLQR